MMYAASFVPTYAEQWTGTVHTETAEVGVPYHDTFTTIDGQFTFDIMDQKNILGSGSAKFDFIVTGECTGSWDTSINFDVTGSLKTNNNGEKQISLILHTPNDFEGLDVVANCSDPDYPTIDVFLYEMIADEGIVFEFIIKNVGPYTDTESWSWWEEHSAESTVTINGNLTTPPPFGDYGQYAGTCLGSVFELDRDVYSPGQDMMITLIAPNADTDPNYIDVVWVSLYSSDYEKYYGDLPMIETGYNAGIFQFGDPDTLEPFFLTAANNENELTVFEFHNDFNLCDYFDSIEPQVDFGTTPSQAEMDKLCKEKFSSNHYYDPEKDLCVRTDAGSDEYCQEEYGPNHSYDPKKDLCVEKLTNAELDEKCKEKFSSNHSYDPKKDLCVEKLTNPELDEKCKEKFGSDRYYDPDKDLCTRTDAAWDKYCQEEYGSDYVNDPERELCVLTDAGEDKLCKEAYGSNHSYSPYKFRIADEPICPPFCIVFNPCWNGILASSLLHYSTNLKSTLLGYGTTAFIINIRTKSISTNFARAYYRIVFSFSCFCVNFLKRYSTNKNYSENCNQDCKTAFFH